MGHSAHTTHPPPTALIIIIIMKYFLAAALFFALLALAVGQDSSTVTVTKATQPVQTVQTVQTVQAVQAVETVKAKEVEVEKKPTVITQVATNQFPVSGGILLLSSTSSASALHASWMAFL